MKKRSFAALAVLVFAAGCASPTSQSGGAPRPVAQTMTLDTTSPTDGDWHWAFAPDTDMDRARTITLNVSTASTPVYMYFLLTNTSSNPSYVPKVSYSLSNEAQLPEARTQAPARSLADNAGPQERQVVSLRDRKVALFPFSRASAVPRATNTATAPNYPYKDFVVDTDTTDFIDAFWYTSSTAVPSLANSHPSHLRSQVVSGSHTVNVWVADDCWAGNGTTVIASNPNNGKAWKSPSHLITKTIADAVAAKFLSNASTDIYGWVTTILGPEWPGTGSPDYLNNAMIEADGNIHIFITNLNPAASDGSVILGYFHAINNFTNQTGSNRKILFAVDADSLGNPSNDGADTNATWATTDYWPSEVFSTLVHEFQHMIQFYQKQVINSTASETDTWINEMASMMMEDLASDDTKLNVLGPRGIKGTYSASGNGNRNGRLPLFNYFHEQVPLTAWLASPYTVVSYSNAYAFGAWLLRNYGGPAVLRDIVTSPYTGEQAVVEAVNANGGSGETFASLVRNWGLATGLRSSKGVNGVKFAATAADDAAYSSSNNFRFSWSHNSAKYSLGSIDLDQYRYYYSQTGYSDGPYIYSTITNTPVAAGATLIAHVFAPGKVFSETITVPANVALTVVATP